MFDLQTKKCPYCGKQMMDRSDLFSSLKDQEIQMKKLGVVFRSNATKDNQYICVECKEKGVASFTCSLCGEQRSYEDMQQSFGDPPEYLCKHCYNIVPAKAWDNKVDELLDIHKYDFE
jgi:hypothetical protein